MLAVGLLLLTTWKLLSAQELLDNPDFEDADGFGKWNGNKCVMTISNDAYNGTQSANVTERAQPYAGIEQFVTVEPDTRYVFQAYIKLTNHKEGYNYHTVKVTLKSTVTSGFKYDSISVQPWLQKDFGWAEIGGDFRTRENVTEAKIYVYIAEPEVNYLFDSASLTKLEDDTTWEKRANDYIEKYRKSKIILKNTLNTGGLTVKIEQLKNEFAFGSVVNVDQIVEPQYENYQKFFYENFEYATIGNALKWKHMERQQGVIDYETPWKAIQVLNQNNTPIRGHCIFWAVENNIPDWAKDLPNLKEILEKRVNDVIQNTTGNLVHWDVDNEALHDDFFERKLNDANISMQMFKWVKEKEPNVPLFLNDYAVINKGTYTTAYKNQGQLFVKAGIPVDAIGLQSHFQSGNIDMTSLRYRLDKIAQIGKPMWVTELSVNEPDVNLKAQALKNVLTMYFGHPQIEGIILWGFWDQRIWLENAFIAEGDGVIPNAAGLQYQALRRAWRTNISQSLDNDTTIIPGFKGTYELTVIEDGEVKDRKLFTLGKEPYNLEISVGGSGSGVTISDSGSSAGVTGSDSGSSSGVTGSDSGSSSGVTGFDDGSSSGVTISDSGSSAGVTGSDSGSSSGVTGSDSGSSSGVTGSDNGSSSGVTGSDSGSSSGVTGFDDVSSLGVTVSESGSSSGVTRFDSSNSSGVTESNSGSSSGVTGPDSGSSSGVTGSDSGSSSGVTGSNNGSSSGVTGSDSGSSSGVTGPDSGSSSGVTGSDSGNSSGVTGSDSGNSSGVTLTDSGSGSGVTGSASSSGSGMKGSVIKIIVIIVFINGYIASTNFLVNFYS